MPYKSVEDLPQAVLDRIKSAKKRRQWLHVWNSSFKQYDDESRAFAAANSVVKKAAGASDLDKEFNFFLPLEKIDKETRTVSGYASTACTDYDGEIISQAAIKAAMPDYWRWRNIREMHKTSAVGVAQEYNFDEKGLYLTAKIVDDDAWKKVDTGVYKGFSIGGRKLAKMGNEITKISMAEISIVDRPCNPECSFTVNKSAGGDADAYLLSEIDAEALEKVAEGAEDKPVEPEDKKLRKKAKKAKKLAKREKRSASTSPPSARDAVGGAEAAPGGTECGHELSLEKRFDGDAGLRLQGGDNLILRKNFKRKARKMSGEDSVGQALLKALGHRVAAKENPAVVLLKAAEKDMKDMKNSRKSAEDCVEKLFDMHKGVLAKSVDGASFDHSGAAKLLQKLYGDLGAMKTAQKAAKVNLEKAAGRVSGSGTVEDPVPGVYRPDMTDELTLISPGEMDNLPAHKAASDGSISKEHAEALVRAAKAEAEATLLKAMPSGPVHGSRPLSYFPGTAPAPEGNPILKLADLTALRSGDQALREAEMAKAVGQHLMSPGSAKSLFDPGFHGTAGGSA